MSEGRPAGAGAGVAAAGAASDEQSRALLAAVVNSSEDAIITATPGGLIGTWNPAAERMYGYTAEEATGLPITALVPPELGEAMMEIYRALLGGERLNGLETKSVRKDGSVFWASVTSFPVTDSDGKVVGGTSIVRDVSDRKRVDAMLRRQTAAIQLLQTVAVAANDASTLPQAADQAIAAVCVSGRWLAGHIYMTKDDGTPTNEGAWYVTDPAVASLPEQSRGGSPPLVARAFTERRAFAVADTGADPSLAWLAPLGVTSVVVVPIVAGQEVYGVAELYGTKRSHADAAALDVLAQVGGTLGRLAERLLAQEVLRASEERNRAILQTASDAFIGMDEAGCITEWNRQAETLFGWPAAQVAGKAFTGTVLAERFREPFETQLRELVSSGDACLLRERRELAALNRDGREIAVEISVLPVRAGGGLTLNAFVRDISERNRMLELQAQLVSVVQSSSDAIIGMAPDCTITSWNTGAEALYGYRADEVTGSYIGILLPGNAGERIPILQRIALGERIHNRETQAQRRDGSIVSVSLSASPILDATGQIAGISSIARDITQAKEAERKIEEANAALKRSVDELKLRNEQVTLISEMGDLLQSCQTLEEACRVIAGSLSQLFAAESGALCLLASSRNMLDTVAAWGDQPSGDSSFVPDACWALRRGRLHSFGGQGRGPLCLHLGTPPPDAYVCVPMMAQGETLGLLHVRCRPGTEDPAAWTVAMGQLALSVAEHVALSLGNFRLRETLRNQSIRDPLTNLYNRRYAEESLEREVRRAARNQTPIGLIAIDLDHFKRFNDRYGHEIGDVVLRMMSEFLASCVRGGDIACRFGGEEFLLILPDASLSVTANRAIGIRDGVRAIRLPKETAAGEGLSVSLGVAAFPDHGSEVRQLVRVADLALYRAKAMGRDQVVVAEAGES
jgi:diguanylate cyclase (GGDEF)-like protein/PAS domain S-box-containing protein